jgi:hypothetical protein
MYMNIPIHEVKNITKYIINKNYNISIETKKET